MDFSSETDMTAFQTGFRSSCPCIYTVMQKFVKMHYPWRSQDNLLKSITKLSHKNPLTPNGMLSRASSLGQCGCDHYHGQSPQMVPLKSAPATYQSIQYGGQMGWSLRTLPGELYILKPQWTNVISTSVPGITGNLSHIAHYAFNMFPMWYNMSPCPNCMGIYKCLYTLWKAVIWYLRCPLNFWFG